MPRAKTQGSSDPGASLLLRWFSTSAIGFLASPRRGHLPRRDFPSFRTAIRKKGHHLGGGYTPAVFIVNKKSGNGRQSFPPTAAPTSRRFFAPPPLKNFPENLNFFSFHLENPRGSVPPAPPPGGVGGPGPDAPPPGLSSRGRSQVTAGGRGPFACRPICWVAPGALLAPASCLPTCRSCPPSRTAPR